MQVRDDRSRQQLLVAPDCHVPRLYPHVIVIDELEDKSTLRADLLGWQKRAILVFASIYRIEINENAILWCVRDEWIPLWTLVSHDAWPSCIGRNLTLPMCCETTPCYVSCESTVPSRLPRIYFESIAVSTFCRLLKITNYTFDYSLRFGMDGICSRGTYCIVWVHPPA